MYFYKDSGGIVNCEKVQGQHDVMENGQHMYFGESIVSGVTGF